MEDMPDIEQLGKIINAVKTAKMLGDAMQGTQENRAEQVHTEAPEPAAIPAPIPAPTSTLCDFDRELQSPAIRSIKAAIPYLDYKYQKNMGIIVKLMEMDRLINHYTVLAAQSGEDKSREMLLAVKNELPEKSRPAADLLMKIMELMEITKNIAAE